MTYNQAHQWINLLSLLKYGVVFGLLLVFLPLQAFEWELGPLNRVFGNMFHDLSFWQITTLSIAFLGNAWSLMYTQGFIVKYRVTSENAFPEKATKFFEVPISVNQFFFYSLLWLPGMMVIIWLGKGTLFLNLSAAILGFLMAFILLELTTLPARLAFEDDYRPLGFSPIADMLYGFLSIIGGQQVGKFLYQLFSRLLWLLKMRFLFPKNGSRLVERDHFFSSTTLGMLLLLFYVASLVVSPASNWAAGVPAAGFLYALIILFIWAFAALQFAFSRIGVSPLVGLLILFLIGYGFHKADQYYTLFDEDPRQTTGLSPFEVAEASRSSDNLVVVTATGGGILAAGWTTFCLEKMFEKRPELEWEIRLLSSISGGSVGVAFYLDERLSKYQSSDTGRPPELSSSGESGDFHSKSMASSLAAVAYGFAFYDSYRILLGGLNPFSNRDRGDFMEEEWARIAAGTVSALESGTGFQVERTTGREFEVFRHSRLSQFRVPIKEGVLPAFIFGTTAVESGRRVMVTPINQWPGPASGEEKTRAQTLAEYINTPVDAHPDQDRDVRGSDLSLWTAARLSATFPYVSPSVTARICPTGETDVSQCNTTGGDHQSSHHFVDGGYYDNYGVTGALDWLEAVLEEMYQKRQKRFKRIAIVQLRSSHSESQVKAITGLTASLIGPLKGLMNIRTGAAFERNQIDVKRFINRWNQKMAEIESKGEQAEAKPESFEIDSFVFQPGEGDEGPLSWHLSKKEKEGIVTSWDDYPMNEKELNDLIHFLDPEQKEP